MADLKRSHYGLANAARGEDMTAFIQITIRNARACQMGTHAQLIAAFESLDADIQSELSKPTEHTTLEEFLTDLRSRESVIRKHAARFTNRIRNAQQFRSPVLAVCLLLCKGRVAWPLTVTHGVPLCLWDPWSVVPLVIAL